MVTRELIKNEIDTLPDSVLNTIHEFISFQKFHLEIFEDDTEYLSSIPQMAEIIMKGKATPLTECLDTVGWDIN
jgi:hypothetical protein